MDLCNIDLAAGHIVPDRNGGRHPGPLAGDGAAHHLTGGGMGDFVSGNAPPGHQKILNFLRKDDALGNLKVPSRGRHDRNVVAVQKLRENADRIVKMGLIEYILPGESINANNFA